MSDIKPKKMPGGGICYDNGENAAQRDADMAKYTDHEPLPDDRTEDVLEQMEMARGMMMLVDDGEASDG